MGGMIYALRVGKYKVHWYTQGWGNPKEAQHGAKIVELCGGDDQFEFATHDPPLLFNLVQDPGELYPIDNTTSEYISVVQEMTEIRDKHNCTEQNPSKHSKCSNQFGPDQIWASDPKAMPWPPVPFHPYVPHYNGTQDLSYPEGIEYCGTDLHFGSPHSDTLQCVQF